MKKNIISLALAFFFSFTIPLFCFSQIPPDNEVYEGIGMINIPEICAGIYEKPDSINPIDSICHLDTGFGAFNVTKKGKVIEPFFFQYGFSSALIYSPAYLFLKVTEAGDDYLKVVINEKSGWEVYLKKSELKYPKTKFIGWESFFSSLRGIDICEDNPIYDKPNGNIIYQIESIYPDLNIKHYQSAKYKIGGRFAEVLGDIGHQIRLLGGKDEFAPMPNTFDGKWINIIFYKDGDKIDGWVKWTDGHNFLIDPTMRRYH